MKLVFEKELPFYGKLKIGVVHHHALHAMDTFVKKLPSRAGSDASSNGAVDDETDRPPVKRLKREQSTALNSEDPEQSILENDEHEVYHDGNWLSENRRDQEHRVTDVENTLPATQTDEAALEAYEEYKSSQASVKDEPSENLKPLWIKGRSSIYVDAFNLALDTVLEEETKLFDGRELDVFNQWKALDYESQYL